MSESIVLCEGYHDRAFWKGILTFLGCTDPGPGVVNAKKERLTGGRFGFYNLVGRQIQVIPCGGKARILPQFRTEISLLATRPRKSIVVCIDPDGAQGISLPDLMRETQHLKVEATSADGHIQLQDGTQIWLVRWEVLDGGKFPNFPGGQTLERLVCEALNQVYPSRAEAVRNWLSSRPEASTTGAKNHAWSFMAGWASEEGCERFFSGLWEDQGVAQSLKALLDANGSWACATDLAQA